MVRSENIKVGFLLYSLGYNAKKKKEVSYCSLYNVSNNIRIVIYDIKSGSFSCGAKCLVCDASTYVLIIAKLL